MPTSFEDGVAFLLLMILFIVALGLTSWVLVEGVFLGRRVWHWLWRWAASRYHSWAWRRYRRGLTRPSGSAKGASRSFGQLRFTRSRAEESNGPPDSHGN